MDAINRHTHMGVDVITEDLISCKDVKVQFVTDTL